VAGRDPKNPETKMSQLVIDGPRQRPPLGVASGQCWQVASRLSRGWGASKASAGGGHCSVPRPCLCLRECALFHTRSDVHRRVAPTETSLEWFLLFASHQNVIKFEKDARPRLASKPSHQHSNNPCGHCGYRCPKGAADVGGDARTRRSTQKVQGEQGRETA
jgi:hypothetical protein